VEGQILEEEDKMIFTSYKNIKEILLFIGLLFFTSSFSQKNVAADSLGKILKHENLSKEERSRILSLRAFYLQDIDSSLISAKLALSIAKEINKPLLEAKALEEISHVERRLGNNTVSLRASLTALSIYESLGIKEKQAASYGQLASNSISDEDYESAINYLKEAKDIYSISDKNGNLILTILNLGEAYRLSGQLDSATIYFKETLKRNKIIKHDVVQSYSLGNLGMVLSSQGKFEEAKKHLTQAIEILKPLGDTYSISIYLAELGDIYWRESKWSIGEEKMLEAQELATNAGLKEQIRDFSGKLSDFYKKKGRYSEALAYLELNKIYQDSLVNKASIQKIEQLKAGYEIDSRETKIGLLNTINSEQKNKMILLVFGVILMILLAYILYKSNKTIKKANNNLSLQKQIIEKSEQEKALLLNELNHRVKNNLQMISSLLSLQSNELDGHPAQEALLTGRNRVEAMSLVHRKLYQDGLNTRIFLKEYIEELVLGLFHGYDVNFKPKFDIADISLSVDKTIPIALIINEMVVNSLKYAYKGIEKPNLKLMVKEMNGNLEIDISDNGIGFTQEEKNKVNSFGIKLISSLVKQLDGSIEKLDSKGTHWKLKLKSA
jgi:two-component sensor histidine kinase